jgi:hypothetical protein
MGHASPAEGHVTAWSAKSLCCHPAAAGDSSGTRGLLYVHANCQNRIEDCEKGSSVCTLPAPKCRVFARKCRVGVGFLGAARHQFSSQNQSITPEMSGMSGLYNREELPGIRRPFNLKPESDIVALARCQRRGKGRPAEFVTCLLDSVWTPETALTMIR